MQHRASSKLAEFRKHQGLTMPLVFAVFLSLFGLSLLAYGFASQQSVALPVVTQHAFSTPISRVASIPNKNVPQDAVDLKKLSTNFTIPNFLSTKTSGNETRVATAKKAPTATHTLASAVPAASASTHADRPLAPSLPVAITIPGVDVQSDLITVSKQENGSIEVPKGTTYNNAAWYDGSPTPGETGSSVIIGHVDSVKTGPSVFFKLGGLTKGDSIEVNRADGSRAKFIVSSVNLYEKDAFPSASVYRLTGQPTLTLVTCGGQFNTDAHDYDSNIVVTASLSTT